ncbi:MAG TPA: hypothetical protein VG897_19630 [Terriglobales bacterium]|nr:hypothetical protein [Terriglobales bacterium]
MKNALVDRPNHPGDALLNVSRELLVLVSTGALAADESFISNAMSFFTAAKLL